MSNSNEAVSENITKRKIDNTTYVVHSFFSKTADKAVLSSIERLIKNDMAKA